MPEVVSFGVHIADALGWPFTQVPDGQHLAFLEEIRFTVAGTAAAPAVNLAKLGIQVSTIGRIGNDAIGNFVKTTMDSYGVDTSHLIFDPDAQTSASLLPIRLDGSRPALHVRGANANLTEDDIPWELVSQAKVFHLGGALLLPQVDGKPMARILKRAKELGLVTTMDFLMSPREDAEDLIVNALPFVDFIMPNLEEAQWLTGTSNRADALSWLHNHGVANTILTLGDEGVSVARRREKETIIPSYNVNVIDTTGCGDAFTSGFISGILEGLSVIESAERGVACGSLVATGLGSDAGIVNLRQVLDFMVATPRFEASQKA